MEDTSIVVFLGTFREAGPTRPTRLEAAALSLQAADNRFGPTDCERAQRKDALALCKPQP